jgi:hypothetical protein
LTSFFARTLLAQLEAGRPGIPSAWSVGCALLVGVAAIVMRRRLPTGMGEGAFIAAVGGSALLLFARKNGNEFSPVGLTHVLTGLTALWYALGRIAVRAERARSGEAGTESRSGAALWGYAALFCGLAALGCLLRWRAGPLVGGSAGTIDFIVLLLLAGLIWIFRTGSWTPYPAVVLVLCMLVSFVPDWVSHTTPAPGGWGLVLIGALCLASVLAVVLDDWRQRRRAWLRAPHLPPAVLPPPHWLFAGVTGMCLCVGLGGVIYCHLPATAWGVWLAAIACFVIGHVLKCERSGEFGLILTVEGIITAGMGWGLDLETGVLMGFAVGGGFLVWQARFWNQQLDEGRAWTTAGRLAPISRRLGYFVIMGAIPVLLLTVSGRVGQPGLYSSIVTILILVAAIRLLIRDGKDYRQAAAFAAASFLVIVSIVPVTRVIYAITLALQR